ncbi:hypothetical protein OAL13_00050 [bacterium]|nr:hypothetical protein [bacterium]
MTTQELTSQLLARREADTVDSEPRADGNDRLQQLNYNFLSLRERIEAKDNELLHLAAGYATTEEWKQLEATYKLESTPSDF